jgi:lipoprotein signal peptidase
MTHPASHMRLWIAAAAGLAADLWSKQWAFSQYDPRETVVLIKNLCSLQLSLNPGALFGIGAGMAPVFVGASVLALLFVLYLFANSGVSRWSMHIALGLVLAGALGNLFDRTTQTAYVGYYPARRVIGKLVAETPETVTVGDYPSGSHPQTYKRPTDSLSGMQPVVRDFIKIEARVGGWSLWPWIFNIADALLVVGVGILLINFWRERKESPAPSSP